MSDFERKVHLVSLQGRNCVTQYLGAAVVLIEIQLGLFFEALQVENPLRSISHTRFPALFRILDA